MFLAEMYSLYGDDYVHFIPEILTWAKISLFNSHLGTSVKTKIRKTILIFCEQNF